MALETTGFKAVPGSNQWQDLMNQDAQAPQAYATERTIFEALQVLRQSDRTRIQQINAAGGANAAQLLANVGYCLNDANQPTRCQGLRLLVSSHTHVLVPNEHGDLVEQLVVSDQSNVPFLAVRPFLTRIVELSNTMTTAPGPLSPETLVRFMEKFVPYWHDGSNSHRYRSRQHPDSPSFCRHCIAKMLEAQGLTRADMDQECRDALNNRNVGQDGDDVEGNGDEDGNDDDADGNGNDPNGNGNNPVRDLWDIFYFEYLHKTDPQWAQLPGMGQTVPSRFVASCSSGSWVLNTAWAAIVEGIYATRLCRPDKMPVYEKVFPVLGAHTSLNTRTDTIGRYLTYINKLGQEGLVPYVVADPNMISPEPTLVLNLDHEVAFSIDGNPFHYSSDVLVYSVEDAPLQAIQGMTVGVNNEIALANLNDINGLFGNAALPPGGTEFMAQITGRAHEAFAENHGEDVFEGRSMKFKVGLGVRNIDWTQLRFSYRPAELMVPLEALLELENHGHKALICFVPLTKGMWVRGHPQPPIRVTTRDGGPDPAHLDVTFELAKSADWAHKLPFVGTLQQWNFYRGMPIGEKGERFRNPAPGPFVAPPAGTPAKFMREAAARYSVKKRKRSKNQRAAETRPPRGTHVRDISNRLGGIGGAKESIFVYINGGNVCFFPPEMFLDSHLRTDASGSRHLKFLVLLEKDDAEKDCETILNEFQAGGLRRFRNNPVTVPMKEQSDPNDAEYLQRLAASRVRQQPWLTTALATFAETYLM